MQAEAIRRWRPWEQSTGPQSAEGKASASRNADKGGRRENVRAMSRMLRGMLREHGEALDEVRAAIPAVALLPVRK